MEVNQSLSATFYLYDPANNNEVKTGETANITLQITHPDNTLFTGSTSLVELNDGAYKWTFTPTQEGMYHVQAFHTTLAPEIKGGLHDDYYLSRSAPFFIN